MAFYKFRIIIIIRLRGRKQSRICYREQQIRTGNCGCTKLASASQLRSRQL